MSLKKMVSSSICTVVLCGAVSAQESAPKQGAFQPQKNANQGTNQSTDKQDASKSMTQSSITPQQIATCLAVDNQEEVILSKFAQEKTKNEEVAKFAKMIAEEHQSCLKKLSKLAPDAAREGYLTGSRSDQPNSRADSSQASASQNSTTSKDRNPNQNNASSNTSINSNTSIDMMQLQREMAQQCITDSKQYLSKKEGAEFDKCFVGMQIAKHAAMHTKLVVLQRHTSDELQQIVAEGIQTTAKHLKAAETLMAKLDNKSSDKLSSTNDK